jgi:hypothetical protein
VDAINAARPREAITSQQDLLTALVGEWDGVYRLWLEPGVLGSESPARATIRPVLDGRYVVHDYVWADQALPSMARCCSAPTATTCGTWHGSTPGTPADRSSPARVRWDPMPWCWAATTVTVRPGAGAPRAPCPTSTTSSSRHGTSHHRVRRTSDRDGLRASRIGHLQCSSGGRRIPPSRAGTTARSPRQAW